MHTWYAANVVQCWGWTNNNFYNWAEQMINQKKHFFFKMFESLFIVEISISFEDYKTCH